MSGTEHIIREYSRQQGALEIAYIEEFFNEFPKRKTAAEIEARLSDREAQILMAEAALPEAPWLHGEVGRRLADKLVPIRIEPAHWVYWSAFLGAGAESVAAEMPPGEVTETPGAAAGTPPNPDDLRAEAALAGQTQTLVREAYMQARRAVLKHYVDLALSTLQPIHPTASAADEREQQARLPKAQVLTDFFAAHSPSTLLPSSTRPVCRRSS